MKKIKKSFPDKQCIEDCDVELNSERRFAQEGTTPAEKAQRIWREYGIIKI
ncbi:MAG: hypothetical protein QCH31_01195 [Methanolobus sp.]|nr:hypothetical protein [Methanolobus sp.]